MLAPIVLEFDVVENLTFVLEWDCFDKFDLLTPLMTFDPDEKNTHVHRQNALFPFKSKNSTIISSGNKNSRSFLA